MLSLLAKVLRDFVVFVAMISFDGERETHRQTDRQKADRQTETDRQTDRQTDR